MTNWIVVAGVIWTFLVTALIFVALSRIIAALRDQRLTRAGLSAASPLHLRLRHMIQVEDRTEIALTVSALVCSAILALLLANPIFETFIRKLVQIVSFR
ncbi:MAG TPA: hypothetical protein DEQ47_14105 [Solibacterales bacterium]|nr:hypothetical protein [Bryobacterales bacterium]